MKTKTIIAFAIVLCASATTYRLLRKSNSETGVVKNVDAIAVRNAQWDASAAPTNVKLKEVKKVVRNALNGPFKPQAVVGEDVRGLEATITRLPKSDSRIPSTNEQYPPPVDHPLIAKDKNGKISFVALKPGDRLSPDQWLIDPEDLSLRKEVKSWLGLTEKQYEDSKKCFAELWTDANKIFSEIGSSINLKHERQALIIPGDPSQWIDVKRRFQIGLNDSVGPATAEGMQALARDQILALTGNFGQYSQLVGFSSYEREGGLHYVASFQTGSTAHSPEIGKAEFTVPPGQTQVQVSKSFLNAPVSLVTIKFDTTPPPMLKDTILFYKQ